MSKINIGEIRLILKGTKFWSIACQSQIMCDFDQIVEITQTVFNSDSVWVKPKQLIFTPIGLIPALVSKGTDEWELSYSKTEPYTIPKDSYKSLGSETVETFNYVCNKCGSTYTNLKTPLDYSTCQVKIYPQLTECNGTLLQIK